jgi:mannose-1-phosphate guanylyltransferase/mannose-6-phosphate isomerase
VTKNQFNEETIVGLFPADHRIPDTKQFETAVRRAAEGAERTGGIVCFGVKPDRPATGYGYIRPAPSSCEESSELREVRRFTEKPDRNRASHLIEENEALWNSGMFFWSAATILRETKQHLPELHAGLMRIKEEWNENGSLSSALETHYSTLPATSVDYGIIEPTDNIWTLPVDFRWNDLGTWESVEELLEKDDQGNGRSGDVITVDVEDSVLVNREGPTVGAIGLEDLVVVSTPNAVLICPKQRSEDVKQLVDKLEETGRDELL